MPDLEAENAELRAALEEYRQREISELRGRVKRAEEAADHYRAEAERNAQVGRQIHAEMSAQLAALRDQLRNVQQVHSARPTVPGRST